MRLVLRNYKWKNLELTKNCTAVLEIHTRVEELQGNYVTLRQIKSTSLQGGVVVWVREGRWWVNRFSYKLAQWVPRLNSRYKFVTSVE